MAQGPADKDATPIESESPEQDREARVRSILQRIYDETLSEPVPDSFNDLLRKLS
jgi:hypothetical protein